MYMFYISFWRYLGAPDIFSSLVAISKGGVMTGLAVAELLGIILF